MTAEVEAKAAATASVAWLVVANKPIYPLYVWWFVGSGTAVAWATALSAPLFLAIALSAARRPLAARVALPLVGAADTVFATVLFGPASGTELFFVPCLLLAIAAFSAHEGRWARRLVAVLFVTFVIAHATIGATIGSGFAPWTAVETAHLREINVFAVASLSAFVGWRFSGTGRDA
ncbi:hypothetical protein [Pinisolibacter aquiterrae]|uniref:hypothetical protein n=1 Tax=Pinisolibacter aquiterrae TaxID=2815579 RepID=UPI001C3E4328|nr:hypothetical protein [Pinisolibacter aquiterrae]MBV5263848.1 hypothetical protein [Pinisolibacter aquiterrae]MCC8237241.1 hypothetical protein [Pinisolibacter aquiterrae]